MSKMPFFFDDTTARVERACSRFLYHEADLLDRGEYIRWLEFLSKDIEYRVPVRTTRKKGDATEFSQSSYFFDEDYTSLKLRADRMGSDWAWSENPAPRIRRAVVNVIVKSCTSTESARSGQAEIQSGLLIFTSLGESSTPLILTGTRHDTIEWDGEETRLRKREVLLDSTVLGMDWLPAFL